MAGRVICSSLGVIEIDYHKEDERFLAGILKREAGIWAAIGCAKAQAE
jgi:hypothetical protein